jgi:hypothetical protein
MNDQVEFNVAKDDSRANTEAEQARAKLSADLTPFVGKLSTDTVNGKTIYEAPGVKDDFLGKFWSKDWDELQSHKVGAPTEKYDNRIYGTYIVTSQFQSSAQDASRENVIFRPNGEVVGMCVQKPNADGVLNQVEWKGSGWSASQYRNSCGDGAEDIVERFRKARRRANGDEQ